MCRRKVFAPGRLLPAGPAAERIAQSCKDERRSVIERSEAERFHGRANAHKKQVCHRKRAKRLRAARDPNRQNQRQRARNAGK